MVNDVKFMRRALTLAKKGMGSASPNPMVGAVVAKHGEIIGGGWHEAPGLPHAEVEALRAAGTNAEGAELFVTLEPCSTHGRTPPCVDAIISAGVARVVVGSLDPNPKHNGKGIEILERAGIKTAVGVEEKKCRELNKAFFNWITTGRPYVLLKMAMTLDGKIAATNGDSKWVTGTQARKRVMELRRWADAIMVGAGTAEKDAPSLTYRGEKAKRRQPRRIVAARSMTPEQAAKTLAPGTQPEIIAASTEKEWRRAMEKLGEKEITSILVEGGGELAAALLKAKAVDEVEFHIAPKILGGRNSIPVVGGSDTVAMAEADKLDDIQIKRLGDDIAVVGRIKQN
jgi:diaminohydroxyphosphoribosylaminopyrimidine deaminase/5-amino-6-(5-phosphoribosylamino)uracil reductase